LSVYLLDYFLLAPDFLLVFCHFIKAASRGRSWQALALLVPLSPCRKPALGPYFGEMDCNPARIERKFMKEPRGNIVELQKSAFLGQKP
jgi:hypothetical protein